jgi:hypothetical protein
VNAKSELLIKSAVPSAMDWQAIQWRKAEKYVEKLQKRIFHAEKNGNVHSDESMLEPYVLKGTRTVLRGEGGSNTLCPTRRLPKRDKVGTRTAMGS